MGVPIIGTPYYGCLSPEGAAIIDEYSFKNVFLFARMDFPPWLSI